MRFSLTLFLSLPVVAAASLRGDASRMLGKAECPTCGSNEECKKVKGQWTCVAVATDPCDACESGEDVFRSVAVHSALPHAPSILAQQDIVVNRAFVSLSLVAQMVPIVLLARFVQVVFVFLVAPPVLVARENHATPLTPFLLVIPSDASRMRTVELVKNVYLW
eukprot:CAMPEP_0178732402 /NCGR_PEP_ID=MMETSP0744-20121128/244_1 /TAXON_ID=913974 /ORGANISM="Nitzschia punctata, Strain CCMP561" /LENGTH=163 /DNA_ID=CAMNT_0020384519 /DNA_START=46 /DNA_END=535 /DNA_ORIENTATION=-